LYLDEPVAPSFNHSGANPSGTGWLAVMLLLLAWFVTWRLIPTVRLFALRSVGQTINERRLNENHPPAGAWSFYAGVLAA